MSGGFDRDDTEGIDALATVVTIVLVARTVCGRCGTTTSVRGGRWSGG